jgi:tetratricopeptide (TPR) repeat protein
LELNPGLARAHSGLAEIYLSQNKYIEAITEAKAAIDAGEDSAAIYLILGVAQTLSRKFADALPNLNETLKRDQNNKIAYLHRADVYIALNRSNDAIADLRFAAAIDKSLPTKLRLGAALLQTRRFDEAITLYREILKEDPRQNEARTALATALIESGKGGEAISQLESLIKTDPERADLRAQLAELYLPAQPEKALEQYLAASRLEPSQPGHQIGIAASMVKLRRFQEAVGLLRQVIAWNPSQDIAYYAQTNLATALFELDDFQNAARGFIWILDYHTRRGDRKRAAIALYFLGICLDKLGDYEQALKAYDQFLDLASPDNQLEIDKVKLRLPSLQRQIKEGKGKRKP